jgi:hypothetical protein
VNTIWRQGVAIRRWPSAPRDMVNDAYRAGGRLTLLTRLRLPLGGPSGGVRWGGEGGVGGSAGQVHEWLEMTALRDLLSWCEAGEAPRPWAGRADEKAVVWVVVLSLYGSLCTVAVRRSARTCKQWHDWAYHL